MSVGYVPVQWNRHKRVYDACLGAGILAYVCVFFVSGRLLYTGREAISDAILAMRALATCAFLMLTVILCIGPLARLNPRFLPLLYNRRHFGVATFLVGLAHAAIAIGFYHGFSNVNPLVSLLSSNRNFTQVAAFPFEILGLAALVILFLMAATSHDFWLRNLGASKWKRLHMLVYVAYALLVLHVALGILQAQRSAWLAALLFAAVATVIFLHLVSGFRETCRDRAVTLGAAPHMPQPGAAVPQTTEVDSAGWLDVCGVNEIADQRGRVFSPLGRERIAVFRYGGRISATANVCAHQAGPLGEGRIVDGCITCPWHGWQYRPGDGQSPPPFTEKINTFRVRVVKGRVQVDPRPLAPGTAVEPAVMENDVG